MESIVSRLMVHAASLPDAEKWLTKCLEIPTEELGNMAAPLVSIMDNTGDSMLDSLHSNILTSEVRGVDLTRPPLYPELNSSLRMSMASISSSAEHRRSSAPKTSSSSAVRDLSEAVSQSLTTHAQSSFQRSSAPVKRKTAEIALEAASSIPGASKKNSLIDFNKNSNFLETIDNFNEQQLFKTSAENVSSINFNSSANLVKGDKRLHQKQKKMDLQNSGFRAEVGGRKSGSRTRKRPLRYRSPSPVKHSQVSKTLNSDLESGFKNFQSIQTAAESRQSGIADGIGSVSYPFSHLGISQVNDLEFVSGEDPGVSSASAMNRSRTTEQGRQVQIPLNSSASNSGKRRVIWIVGHSFVFWAQLRAASRTYAIKERRKDG